MAPDTCLLSSCGEVSKQAVQHVSVSELRAMPTTRLKGRPPLCVAAHRGAMLILILTETERVVVFHFVGTYHRSFIASPGGKKKK